MGVADPYPPGPPGTPRSASDKYFQGLTYGRAWNAFWLGLSSLVCCGFLTGLPAVYVGARALSDIEASRGRLTGRGMAWAGIVLGALGTVATTGLAWHRMRH